MKHTTSIYSKQHPKIREILKSAGTPAKAICVAIDYAKHKHVVLFCDGAGDILKQSFVVENSPAGVRKLLDELSATRAYRGVKNKHVFFGGEDNPACVQNFIKRLTKEGYLVVRVNAWEAKHQRDNNLGSTDNIDLLGIAKAVLNKASYSDEEQSATALCLKEASRTRSCFVRELTAQKLRVHNYADRLLPGFLNEAKSGIAPFSSASLALLGEGISVQQIKRWSSQRLIEFLQRQRVDDPQGASQLLKDLADKALEPAPELSKCWQTSLSEHVLQCKSLEQSVQAMEKQMAYHLARSSGALLTSISGIGVVLAAGIVGEFGDPASWRSVASLCSYCAIVPRVEQTGGPDKPAKNGKVQHRGNQRAKNWIVQAASLMGRCGPAELKDRYRQLESRGQHADFAMAKKLLRICKSLFSNGNVFRPKSLLSEDTPVCELKAYYIDLWDRILRKWAGLIDGESLADPQFPLGRWRQMAEQFYKISLPVPKSKIKARKET